MFRKLMTHLETARDLLPEQHHQKVNKFIAVREYFVAWEAMKEIAESLDLNTTEFWRAMAMAAGLMVESGYE